MRETHDALGPPSQLIMCHVEAESDSAYVMCRGGVCHAYLWVWTLSAAVRTSQSFDYISLLPVSHACDSGSSQAWWGPGPWTWKQTQKQTNTELLLGELLWWLRSAGFPQVARPQTHTCYQSVCPGVIVYFILLVAEARFVAYYQISEQLQRGIK